jgi:hypothetical protein
MPLRSGRCAPILCSATLWVGGEKKMPDAKTMGRCGLAVGPDVLGQIHDRMVEIAKDKGAVGRRMRVDSTVVKKNIHYPTIRPTARGWETQCGF